MSLAPAPFRPRQMIRDFLATEAASGSVLVGAAIVALAIANSPLADGFTKGLHAEFAGLSLLHWVNDGLMAVFFLLVGLEIKRELISGQLSTAERRILPAVAAAVGMAVPALLYLLVVREGGDARRGWAIPAATDIAFALGVLALLGKRVPPSLRILLTAVAIIDDLGAIIIIALFYTAKLDLTALAVAGAGVGILVALNRVGVIRLTPYLIVGAGIWYFVRLSGVHATLAGVVVAIMIPLRIDPQRKPVPESPLYRLEHALNPLVAFGVAPLFALANAGVSFTGSIPASLIDPIPFGIIAGLVVGKQTGIFGAVWLMCRMGLATRPRGASWRQIYGISLLCGIGFTMSLFISGLAFGDGSSFDAAAKLGVLFGSVASAIMGYRVLSVAGKK